MACRMDCVEFELGVSDRLRDLITTDGMRLNQILKNSLPTAFAGAGEAVGRPLDAAKRGRKRKHLHAVFTEFKVKTICAAL